MDGYNHRSNCLCQSDSQADSRKKAEFWHVGGAIITYPYHHEAPAWRYWIHFPQGGISVSAIGLIARLYRSHVTPVYFGCQIGLRTNRFPSYNTIPRYGSRLAFEVFMCSHKSQVECIIGTINRGLRLRQKLLIDSLQSYKYDMRQSKSRKELAPNTPPKSSSSSSPPS